LSNHVDSPDQVVVFTHQLGQAEYILLQRTSPNPPPEGSGSEAIGRHEGRNHSREVDGISDSFRRKSGGFSSILPMDAPRLIASCGDILETAKLQISKSLI